MGLTANQYRKTDEYKQTLIEMAANPVLFGRTITKAAKVDSADFHYEISDLWLDDEVQYANIIAPRGFGKSTVVGTFLPLHHIIFDEGDKFILIVSKTQGHATSVLAQIKKTFYNKKFKYLFGDYTENTAEVWTKSTVKLKDGTMITTKGSGQQIRGLISDFQRPTLIIGDDLQDNRDVRTSEAQENMYRWFTESLMPSIDPQRGRIFSIGTPVSMRCIVERLAESTMWKTRRYSAEDDPENEQSLWPEWVSWDQLMDKKNEARSNGTLMSYSQEYLSKVIPSENRLFKREYLRYWDGNIEVNDGDHMLTHWPVNKYGERIGDKTTENVNVYAGIDSAVTTGVQSDYSVIVTIAVNANNDRFVLPFVRGRFQPHKLLDVIWSQYVKYKPKRTSNETSGQQNFLRDMLMSREGKYIPGISKKHNPTRKKEKRHIDMLQPWFSDRKVYLKRNMQSLEEELYYHPKSKHDDILDALTLAFKYAIAPKTRTKSKKYTYRKNAKKVGIDDQWLLA